MHDLSSPYMAEASAADKALDEQLAILRREEADGEITTCEAAAERVRALEAHLAAIRALRARYFGGSE